MFYQGLTHPDPPTLCGGSLQKSFSQNCPFDLLDRGCVSRRRILSRKERKVRKAMKNGREAFN
ncbi:MAG: hypothetical protein IKX40_13810 [Thermoguttaceae bacterium]|nr:hypothetical protein [Thermoguttaceae bacterium]